MGFAIGGFAISVTQSIGAVTPAPPAASYLLNEDGTYVLDEAGNKIILEGP